MLPSELFHSRNPLLWWCTTLESNGKWPKWKEFLAPTFPHWWKITGNIVLWNHCKVYSTITWEFLWSIDYNAMEAAKAWKSWSTLVFRPTKWSHSSSSYVSWRLRVSPGHLLCLYCGKVFCQIKGAWENTAAGKAVLMKKITNRSKI